LRSPILAALLHGTRAVGVSQICGVQQRASPIFGRAAITLGIGPHSRCFSFVHLLFLFGSAPKIKLALISFWAHINIGLVHRIVIRHSQGPHITPSLVYFRLTTHRAR